MWEAMKENYDIEEVLKEIYKVMEENYVEKYIWQKITGNLMEGIECK